MKDKKFCILHLEDDRNDAELISNTVKEAFPNCEILHVDSQEDFLKALDTGEIDLILSDAALPKFDGFLALSIIRERYPRIPFILVSGTIGEEFAIDSLHRGATDYILKHRLLRLVPAINRALKERERRE